VNNLVITVTHPASGLNFQTTLADLVKVGKLVLPLVIQTAPIWLPLVLGSAAPPAQPPAK